MLALRLSVFKLYHELGLGCLHLHSPLVSASPYPSPLSLSSYSLPALSFYSSLIPLIWLSGSSKAMSAGRRHEVFAPLRCLMESVVEPTMEDNDVVVVLPVRIMLIVLTFFAVSSQLLGCSCQATV